MSNPDGRKAVRNVSCSETLDLTRIFGHNISVATSKGNSGALRAPSGGRRGSRGSTDNDSQFRNSYPLAEAKAQLSKIVRHVQATGEEVVVTHHGKPVARVVPDRGAGPRTLGFARGRVKFKKGWDQPVTYEDLLGE